MKRSRRAAGYGLTATPLRNGSVLVAGFGGTTPAEVYNPAKATWTSTGAPAVSQGGFVTATLLADGQVLVAGGNQPALSSAEVFNNGFWFPVHSMTQPRVFQTATALPGGSVLAAGGGPTYYAAGASTAEVFTPVVMSVNPASGPAGTQVTVTGSGLYAGETVTLYWDGLTVLGHVKTTATGSFRTTITIPQATAGAHVIAARGRHSFAGTNATFTVTG